MRSGVDHTVLTANTPHLHLPVIHVPNYMDHYSSAKQYITQTQRSDSQIHCTRYQEVVYANEPENSKILTVGYIYSNNNSHGLENKISKPYVAAQMFPWTIFYRFVQNILHSIQRKRRE